MIEIYDYVSLNIITPVLSLPFSFSRHLSLPLSHALSISLSSCFGLYHCLNFFVSVHYCLFKYSNTIQYLTDMQHTPIHHLLTKWCDSTPHHTILYHTTKHYTTPHHTAYQGARRIVTSWTVSSILDRITQ